MIYIFMDNYRGFSETLIPVRQATFLVGENSTGKSSFLTLLYLLSTPNFWFSPDFSAIDYCDLGGFKDIVSAGSRVKTHFTVGMLTTQPKKGSKANSRIECSFTLMTFRDDEGVPRLSRYVQYTSASGKLVKVNLLRKVMRYKSTEERLEADNEDSFIDTFIRLFHGDEADKTGFRALPSDMPPNPPIPFIISMIQSLDQPKKKGEFTFTSELPSILNLEWLAPIRSKPKRTYDGLKTNFSPEGSHTPHIIRDTLSSKDKAKNFAKLLRKFGNSSGLFKSVKAHSFGKGPAAPFEVLVEIADQPLNINNVGYGVSQVLPVIVEMLTQHKGHWFAIQQPEVHLHPKAQAALGDLMHFLMKERGHHYVVETHSDYLIDRFRLRMKESKHPKYAEVVFFERSNSGNTAHILPINDKGQYPKEQPKGFRDFFINEEMHLLEI